MVVRCEVRTVLPGFRPVFFVGSAEEARVLMDRACFRDRAGQDVSPDLYREQTAENLTAFSDRLAHHHEVLVLEGRCACSWSTEVLQEGVADA